MEILVLKLGSSSIKFKLFDMKENKPLASGLAEKIGEEIGQLKIKSHLHHNDQELKEKLVIKDHASGLLMIRENLTKMGIIKDFNQIDAIGHRVVQGGDKFHAPVLVDEKVMQEIGKLSILAPLHNPANDNPGNALVNLIQPDTKVQVLRIPTDEELEIALQAKEIVEKLK